MSLSVFGIFLSLGSDAQLKIRGDCQDARHRGWIECIKAEIDGSTSYTYVNGIGYQVPVVGTYHAPIDPPSEQNPAIREDLMKRYPVEPTDVHLPLMKDKAPIPLQVHANLKTEFDVVLLDKYMRSDDVDDLDQDPRIKHRGNRHPTGEHRNFVNSYALYNVTIAAYGAIDQNAVGMRFNFKLLREPATDLPN